MIWWWWWYDNDEDYEDDDDDDDDDDDNNNNMKKLFIALPNGHNMTQNMGYFNFLNVWRMFSKF